MPNRNRSAESSRYRSGIASQAEKKINQLKRERDKQAATIVMDAEKALAAVRERLNGYKEERRRKREDESAQRLKRIESLTEKRRQIEEKMLDVVTEAHSAMQEVEEMMLAGYEGRQKEAEQALEALEQKRREQQ